MNLYHVGTRVFCDHHFGGKPSGIVTAILKPGNGKNQAGLVRVRLTETIGPYRKGETLELSTYYAVPVKEVSPVKQGQYFTRVSTLYRYE